jgi:hypothetical protein
MFMSYLVWNTTKEEFVVDLLLHTSTLSFPSLRMERMMTMDKGKTKAPRCMENSLIEFANIKQSRVTTVLQRADLSHEQKQTRGSRIHAHHRKQPRKIEISMKRPWQRQVLAGVKIRKQLSTSTLK